MGSDSIYLLDFGAFSDRKALISPMARLPRFFAEGQPLHIIQRGNNRDPFFAAEPDYLFYLDCLERAARVHALAIHAYVLMTNHVHLLATPSHEASLPKTLQSVGRRYVQYFNYTYRRTGTLWEGRYRSTVIDSERYLLTCMRYIELNPYAPIAWQSTRLITPGRVTGRTRSAPRIRC